MSMGATALFDYRKRKLTAFQLTAEIYGGGTLTDEEARVIYDVIHEHGIRPGQTFCPQELWSKADKQNYVNRRICHSLINRGLFRLQRLSPEKCKTLDISQYVIGSRDGLFYRLYVSALAPVLYDAWACGGAQ
jgi:hypothetical protein